MENFRNDHCLQKYAEAKRLSEEESKNDPETEPYRSKYKARDILTEVKSLADEYLSSDDSLFVLACLNLKLGANYVETEELSTGEEYLQRCISELDEFGLHEQGCRILQSALNQLGVIWCSRKENDKALHYLERAKDIYSKYRKEIGNAPHLEDELLLKYDKELEDLVKTRSDSFEDGYTHTLYYLAQVHRMKEENEKSAEYCHETLIRQLETNRYNAYDWAINCATLSQYYISEDNYPLARHCLASASTIFDECDNDSDATLSESEIHEENDKKDKLLRGRADIERCWAKYGLAIMEYSQDKLMAEIEGGVIDTNEEEQAENHDDTEAASKDDSARGDEENIHSSEYKPKMLFNIEITAKENQVTDQPLVTFDEARPVFLAVQKWLSNSKEYYILDGHCTDYIEIVKDMSNAYRRLAFFETDFERQCKMHKRRIDILTEALKELNPQFYLLICRQLMFELGETHSHMLDLKLAIIEETESTPSHHAASKINTLARQGISQFSAFLDSMKESGKLPEKYAEDNVRPALLAHFYIGRLYSKFLVQELPKRLENMQQSVNNYGYLVKYCMKNPEDRACVKNEVDVCAEMVVLLPRKMEKMLSESSQ